MIKVTREEAEKYNRVLVSMKDKIMFVVWFVLAIIVLTAIGIWKSGGFGWR